MLQERELEEGAEILKIHAHGQSEKTFGRRIRLELRCKQPLPKRVFATSRQREAIQISSTC